MKSRKPLQFVKDLPSHAELWKTIDDTIIHPGEGLSVEQIKHYMYSYLCVSSNFKIHKNMLQTEMDVQDILTIKNHIQKHRTMAHPELLPEIPGLSRELLVFIYEYMVAMNALPDKYIKQFSEVIRVCLAPIPNLSTLPHSSEVVEVYEKRQVELAIYRALIEDMPIPTFKLVVDPTENTSDASQEGGWIPWHGGECPVGATTRVQIRYRIGNATPTGTASGFRWGHRNISADIVAYRIVKERI